MRYAFLPMLIQLFCQFLTEHTAGQFRLLILVMTCWMDAPWLPTFHGMLEDVPCECDVKKSHLGCFGRLGTECSVTAVFNPWLLKDVCHADKDSSSQSCNVVVWATQASATEEYQQSKKEWRVWYPSEDIPNSAITELVGVSYSAMHLIEKNTYLVLVKKKQNRI